MCGIAAFIGSHNKDTFELFDPALLHFLMVAQDTRGRDNCGLYYRGFGDNNKIRELIQWGHSKDVYGPTKTFAEFLKKRKDTMLPYAPPYKVIAHSRKASAGSEILDNAHPFKHGNIIGVHNGTLTDWRSLMRALNVDIEDIDVDSSAIFKAISEGKTEEILSMYTGAAALVWTELNDKKDIINVWCGESYSHSNYMYNSKKEVYSIERPLHYMETAEGFYISSENTPLESLKMFLPVGVETGPITQFKGNAITRFENGKIVSIKEIARKPFNENFTKKTENTPTSSTSVQSKLNLGTISKDPQKEKGVKKDNIRHMEGSQDSWFQPRIQDGRYYRNTIIINSSVKFTNPIGFAEKADYDAYGAFCTSKVYINKVDNFFYYFNNAKNMFTRADGKIHMPLNTPHIEECWFYEGIRIKDFNSIKKLYKKRIDYLQGKSDENVSYSDVASVAVMPVPVNIHNLKTVNSNSFVTFGFKALKPKVFSGNFQYSFTEDMYVFEAGIITEKLKVTQDLFDLNDSNNFRIYRESYSGKYVTIAGRDLFDTEKIWSLCPKCSSKNTFTLGQFKKIPKCVSCDNRLVLDETVETEL